MSSPARPDRPSGPTRRALLRIGFGAAGAAVLPSCTEAVPEPRPVKWQRESCEHCRMPMNDRRFAAEVWDGERRRARVFDDFGCAVLAALEDGSLDRAGTPIWVVDAEEPSRWLEARAASYRDGADTPMGYGFLAGRPGRHPLDFAAAVAGVREKAICEHKS